MKKGEAPKSARHRRLRARKQESGEEDESAVVPRVWTLWGLKCGSMKNQKACDKVALGLGGCILTCAVDVLASFLPPRVQLHRRLTALVLLLHLSPSAPLPPLIWRPSPLSFFNPFCPALPPPLHFLRPLSLRFPALSLSLSSFHAALGFPKRLGLNGENLLWYNELGERQRGGGGETRGWGGVVLDTGGEGGAR